MQKFKCQGCGKCCSKISGLQNRDVEFILEFGYGKTPLAYAVDAEKVTFPLWDTEAKRFLRYSKEIGIDVNIIPQKGILDLMSNKFIVLAYQMNHDSCPFLMNGKCRIYDRERALVCRLFPFNHSPNFRGATDETIFGECPQINEIRKELENPNKDKTGEKTDTSMFQNIFGDCYNAVIENDSLIEESNRTIIRLMKENKIKPAMNYPINFLRKRIENAEKIDFSDYIQQTDK